MTNVIEQDPEECIHGMWPPNKCTICLQPKTDSGFKFELITESDDDGT